MNEHVGFALIRMQYFTVIFVDVKIIILSLTVTPTSTEIDPPRVNVSRNLSFWVFFGL